MLRNRKIPAFSAMGPRFSLSRALGEPSGAFSGPDKPARDRSPLQKPGKWRNTRLIPDDIENSYDNHIENQNLLTKFAALFFFEMLIFSVFHAPEPKV